MCIYCRLICVVCFSVLVPASLWASVGSAWAPGVSRESGWIDVNKAWNPYSSADISAIGSGAYSDANMCWAAQSSNMLQYWQNAYVAAGNILPAGAPDGFVVGRERATRRQYQIFDYFVNNWTDDGGNGYYGIPWYMTGGFYDNSYPADDGWAQRRENSAGTGGFFKNIYPDANTMFGWNYNYTGRTWEQLGDFRSYNYSTTATYGAFGGYGDFSSLLINSFEKEKAVVGLSVSFINAAGEDAGGHAVTAWGCEFDENGFVTEIYLTDSDDGIVSLDSFEVVADETGVYLSTYSSAYATKIHGLSSLSVGRFLAVPEPASFSLLAGTLMLGFVAVSRRRSRFSF